MQFHFLLLQQIPIRHEPDFTKHCATLKKIQRTETRDFIKNKQKKPTHPYRASNKPPHYITLSLILFHPFGEGKTNIVLVLVGKVLASSHP